MGSCSVEVPHIVIEHALELLLAEDEEMVQAFLSDTPQEAFADGIGSWGMNRRGEYLNGTCGRHASKAWPKFVVVISYQILGCMPIRGGFSKLLGHPGIGRRARDAHMDHPSRSQFDEEEGKERSKEQIGDLQEVAGPDLVGVCAQKGRPPLASWLLGANSSHVLLDRALTHVKAQLQEFSTNSFSTPKPIVLGHLPDQGDGFRSHLRLVSTSL